MATASTPSSSAAVPRAACWRTGCRRAPAIRCCCLRPARIRRPAASRLTCSIPIRGSYYNPAYFWPELKVHWRLASNSPLTGYSQGRIMGGGSSVMGMVALRGTPEDYDEWEEVGAAGWGWNDVLPFFKKLETRFRFRRRRCTARTARCRCAARRSEQWPPLSKALADFASERQIPYRRRHERGFSRRLRLGADEQLAGQAGLGRDLLSRRRGRGRGTTSRSSPARPSPASCSTAAAPPASRAEIGGETSEFAAARSSVSLGGIHSPAMLMRAGHRSGRASARSRHRGARRSARRRR